MNFQLEIDIPSLEPRIQHQDPILLTGSCFTEHITRFLQRSKFKVAQNPHGIVFNPISLCRSLVEVVEKKVYTGDDLFYFDEYWHSWHHHSDFSALEKDKTLENINSQIRRQHEFLQHAQYVFITLGSAFAYKLVEPGKTNDMVWPAYQSIISNNHRAPAAWFEKKLLAIEDIKLALENCIRICKRFNPDLKFVFTVSPVRHIRDGIVENTHSKARLLEAVHSLENIYYFPAYELVMDVLRDYRFYDLDMAHPNYQATAYVWERFIDASIAPECLPLMKQLEQLFKAKSHIPKDTRSEAHKKFREDQKQLCKELMQTYPYLDLREEITYFSV